MPDKTDAEDFATEATAEAPEDPHAACAAVNEHLEQQLNQAVSANHTYASINAKLRDDNERLSAQIVSLEAQINALVNDAMKPAPIVVEQADAAGYRDAACATRRAHVSGCGCTGEQRAPIR